MSDLPPPTQPTSDTGALRIVTILVMIAAILGLLGTGFCAIAFLGDAPSDAAPVLLFAVPPLLFFVGAIWVCKALLERLKK